MITSLSPGPVVAQQCRSGEGQTAIRLNEAFTNAFKLEGSPDFVSYNAQWESGYYAPGSNNGGGASQATRFLLRFVNVPSGVQVDLPRHVDTGSDPAVTGDALELRLLEGTDERGAGGALVAGEGLQSVALSSGTGSAVYEVVDEDPFRLDTIDIPISVSWTSDTANGMPGLGDARVIATLAPLSTVLEASGPEPEPRFVDNGGEGLVFFSSVPCTTTLLFSTVSNQQGSDTRIAIANTSGLSAGGEGEAGACTVHYHGAMEGGGAAPSDQTSVILQPGEQLDFTLSGGSIAQGIPGAPGFAGYVMAECEFDGAVGRSNQAAQQVEIETAPETVLRDAQRVRQSQTLGLVLDFVSDRNDLDTEISVINTTEDWFGTQLESGQCFVKLGSTGFQTPEILGGETYTFQVSSISPGFEGMVSIDCAFAEARAFAKVTRTPTPGQPAPQAFGLTAERRPAAAGSSTQLLLPHIDSRNRLHSWLVVTNTSVGLGASTPTGGTCTLSYLGDAGSPTIAPQTLALAAGEQVRFRLSEGLPAKGIASASDFFGSLALSCDFPLARATALSFEGTGGRSRASFAQQAEVISAPRSTLVHSVTFPGLADTAQRQPIVTLTNTTLDVFGTTPQAGSCLLDYRGTAPGGVPSPTAVSLAAGERLRFAISEGLAAKGVPAAPGFVGFLVATCDFPLARGLQFRRKAVTPLQLSQRPGVYLDGEWRLDVDGDAVFNPAVDKRIFLGFPGATPVVGDWNGDGRDDVGVYAGGFWFLDFDGDANWDGGVNDKLFAYGFAGAEPVVGDWNGDGRDDVGVYAKGFWFLDANGDQLWDGGVQDTLFGLGWPGVTTLVGDWNGDGRDKVGVYALGFWFLDYDGDANWDGGVVDRQFGWGGWSGIKPIPGDWNGDGRDQAAVAPVNQTGSWFVDYDGDAQYGPADRSIPLGFSGTEPVPGDWNGDGRMTPGIVNAKTFWFPDVNGDYLWAQPGDPIWTWGLGSLNSVIFPGRW
ncbi:MAG: hypothetical protein GC160_18550 [Acidobacteria bacterium]|nr:hypothetical protein [Acidobacteriota bacterium]